MRRSYSSVLTTVQRETLTMFCRFAREHGRSMTYAEWQRRTGKAMGTLGNSAKQWRSRGLLEESGGAEASLLPSRQALQLLGIPEEEWFDLDAIRLQTLPQKYHVPQEVSVSLDALIALVTDLRAQGKPIQPDLEEVCRWWSRVQRG